MLASMAGGLHHWIVVQARSTPMHALESTLYASDAGDLLPNPFGSDVSA